MSAVDKGFKLALEITSLDESAFSFPNIMIGVTPESGQDGTSTLLRIAASGGFDASAEGALDIADLLADAARAIQDKVAIEQLAEAAGLDVEQAAAILEKTQGVRNDFNEGAKREAAHKAAHADGVISDRQYQEAATEDFMGQPAMNPRFNPRPVGPGSEEKR